MVRYQYSLGDSSTAFFIMPASMDSMNIRDKGLEVGGMVSTLIWDIDMGMGFAQTVIRDDDTDQHSAVSLWASYVCPNNLTLMSESAILCRSIYIYPADYNLDVDYGTQDQTRFSQLVGANYVFTGTNIGVRAEYYHNGLGYTERQRKYFVRGLQNAFFNYNLGAIQNFTSNYDLYLLSRNFFGISVNYPDIKQLFDCRIGYVYGMDDQSNVFSGSIVFHPLDKVNYYCKAIYNTGVNQESEFKQQVQTYQVKGGIIVYF
jgi:hypothetical protein